MRRLVRWAVLSAWLPLALGILLPPATASANIYYIDFSRGSDSNSGTSKAAPWKHQPYMNGFTGSYGHVAGDQFIFKGGVTWDSTCWPLIPLAGGSSNAVRDYYGVDLTWFTGGSFARPIFDAANVVNTWPSSTMFRMLLSNITIDNIEMKNLLIPSLVGTAGGGSFIGLGGSNSTVENVYLHAWDIARFSISTISRTAHVTTVVTSATNDFANGQLLVIYGVKDTSFNTNGNYTAAITVDSGTQFHYAQTAGNASSSGGTAVVSNDCNGGVLAGGGTANNVVDRVVIENSAHADTGCAIHNIAMVSNSTIHDTQTALLGVNSAVGNTIYNLGYPTAAYDLVYHTNLIYQLYSGTINNNLFYNIHIGEDIYPNPEGDSAVCGTNNGGVDNVVTIYNNVLMSNATTAFPNFIDANPYNGNTPCDKIYIYNNTIQDATVNVFIRVINRGGFGGLKVLDVRNNHFITENGGATICLNNSPDFCGAVETYTLSNYVVQTNAVANAQGYVAGNNYAPTLSSNATVHTGTSVPSSIFNTDRLGVQRPKGLGWDAGAYQFTYQFTNVKKPAPPSNLVVISH